MPDGTFGYRVVHRNGERFDGAAGGECNGLMVSDIEWAMRDPRRLEDLIDAVELYGVYAASLTAILT